MSNNVLIRLEHIEKKEENVSYITQDTYYVDYLTVIDNLRLAATETTDLEIQTIKSML